MVNLILTIRTRLNTIIHREIEGAVQASRHTIVVSSGNKLFCNYSVTSNFFFVGNFKIIFPAPFRFHFTLLFLIFALIDIFIAGENSTFTTLWSFLHFHILQYLHILFTCSPPCGTGKYPDMVMQFSGFHRQFAQCISLLHPVRYLTTCLLLLLNL